MSHEMLVSVLQWSVVLCFAHLVTVYGLFLLMLFYAVLENVQRARQQRAEDFDALAGSRFTIPVSVICPAYNEEALITTVVRSLLAQRYPELEVVVVNDGSRDRTLEVLRREYELERREVFYRRTLPSQPVLGVYRSRRDPRLTVVDKVNGGKADALNCGLNLSRYRYVCTVDGDTVFLPDALLRGMHLAVKDPARVVGVTSHVGIAERPETRVGEAPGERRADETALSNFQHLDYLRSFVNNRLAWSRLDFMLCSVGAFAIWRRDVVMELGGFSTQFTCEDIELTFRVHEAHLRQGKRVKVLSLPDTIAFTEGPARLAQLISQRARWQRVILETVWHYRHMLLNPRYGTVGLLGMPYYVVAECLAPFFEALAVLTVPAALALGVFGWPEMLAFIGFMSFGNAAFSAAALLLQDVAAREYRLRDLARLSLLAPAEMLLYRPWLTWARLKGTWGFLRGDKRWHKFERNARPQAA